MSDYKNRRKAAGYKFVGFWVTEEQEIIVKALLKGMEVTGLAPEYEKFSRGGDPKRGKVEEGGD